MEKLFEIDQLELVEKTKAILKTVPDKAIIPANEYIHLKSFDGGVAISASNPENTTRLVLESGIFDHPFDICIDHSFLKPLSKREMLLTFSLDINRCVITCKDSKWEVPMIPSQDFPELNKDDWQQILTIDADLLKEVLGNVGNFTFQDPGTSISKIHFKQAEDYLCIGASNHFSCGLHKLDMHVATEDEISFLISRETASLICDIATKGSVEIYKSQDHCLKFQCQDNSVASVRHAFEGNPVNDYYQLCKKYIEREHDTITVVDKDYLKDQVKKAIAFSPYDMKALLIHILGGRLRLEVEDYISHKRSIQEIEILMDQKGDATLMGLPYDHLIRVLSCIKGESIEMEIPLTHGGDTNCIKEPILVQDESYTYMIMPLTV